MVWAVRQLRRRAGGGAGRWRARRRSGCGRRRWRARPRGRTASSSPRQTWTGSSRTASRWGSIVSFTNEWKEEKTCLIFTLSRVKRDNFVRAVQTQRLTSESEIGCYTTILWIWSWVHIKLLFCHNVITTPVWGSILGARVEFWNNTWDHVVECGIFVFHRLLYFSLTSGRTHTLLLHIMRCAATLCPPPPQCVHQWFRWHLPHLPWLPDDNNIHIHAPPDYF